MDVRSLARSTKEQRKYHLSTTDKPDSNNTVYYNYTVLLSYNPGAEGIGTIFKIELIMSVSNASYRPSQSSRAELYQIDFAAVAAGKRIASTKRRIRW